MKIKYDKLIEQINASTTDATFLEDYDPWTGYYNLAELRLYQIDDSTWGCDVRTSSTSEAKLIDDDPLYRRLWFTPSQDSLTVWIPTCANGKKLLSFLKKHESILLSTIHENISGDYEFYSLYELANTLKEIDYATDYELFDPIDYHEQISSETTESDINELADQVLKNNTHIIGDPHELLFEYYDNLIECGEIQPTKIPKHLAHTFTTNEKGIQNP